MNFAQDESILTDRFQTEVLPYWDKYPVDYAGQANTPLDHRLIQFRVKRSTSRQVATMNNHLRPLRNFGSVLIRITTPTNEGSGEILDVCDRISKAFTGFRKGGLLCRVASVTGPTETGAFLEATVDVPFTSDYHA